jgi:hypothetical protein
MRRIFRRNTNWRGGTRVGQWQGRKPASLRTHRERGDEGEEHEEAGVEQRRAIRQLRNL